jgi:hypothetical protein
VGVRQLRELRIVNHKLLLERFGLGKTHGFFPPVDLERPVQKLQPNGTSKPKRMQEHGTQNRFISIFNLSFSFFGSALFLSCWKESVIKPAKAGDGV